MLYDMDANKVVDILIFTAVDLSVNEPLFSEESFNWFKEK